LLRETGAQAVFWNRRYEPAIIARDQKIKQALRESGMEAESYNAALLHEPWTVRNKSEKPFQVFTPFWKHCLTLEEPGEPLAAPTTLAAPKAWPRSAQLADFQLEPRIDWAAGFRATWQPGAAGAFAQLDRFLDHAVLRYTEDRNRPDLTGTSRLSPHLHFGEISPRQIWHRVRHFAEANNISPAQWRGWQYLSEVGWREFAHHLLFHFPQTIDRPLRADFERFPWKLQEDWLAAWTRGATGYPLVDAGMRELWHTGWMHNRVRMVVGSFLVKNLLISWTEGARWFWDTLVDADLAQNTLGWQWISGCGADAAPYFRIFNPISQGEKFDPRADYVRRWVPELARLPIDSIHAPWQATPLEMAQAGVVLGKTYPRPIVDHAKARETALAAFAKLKSHA
jgi:deoxyribodipyrimidine photo-lyase